MNLIRGLFGNKATEQPEDSAAAESVKPDAATEDPTTESGNPNPGTEAEGPAAESQDFDPALEALFERANQVRAQAGLEATDNSTIAAQVVLTSIAMEVLQVADRQLHPDLLDARDADLAWAYVCFMGVRIIAIVDEQDDFDHQAFVLAVAFSVFQFYGDQVAIQIVHSGTGLFHRIVTEQQESPEFVELNNHVHKLILAYICTGLSDAISGLQQGYAVFAKLSD